MPKNRKGNETQVDPNEKIISENQAMPIVQSNKKLDGGIAKPNIDNIISAKDHVDDTSRL